MIVARGAFNGVGRIVEAESPPGEEALLDDLVFRSGTMHHVSNVTGFDVAINPRTCVVTITITSTGAVVGGTGIFEHASGTFDGTLIGKGLVPRNADGSCDTTNPPVTDIEYITETGTLSF